MLKFNFSQQRKRVGVGLLQAGHFISEKCEKYHCSESNEHI